MILAAYGFGCDLEIVFDLETGLSETPLYLAFSMSSGSMGGEFQSSRPVVGC
ncbi:MAG: hypothetical protein JXR89_12440 [Deltaproteobacteria bacterium]|nr:hypothetical protein [Deltaproteobacteria bacterium]